MEEGQKVTLFTAIIAGAAANRAVVRLHALLAAKGVLNNGDIEALRHLHLLEFDVAFEGTGNRAANKDIADLREQLDRLWQEAVQSPLPRGDSKS